MPENSADKAWLVTWESATQDDCSVELVLPDGLPVERVRWLVQELYLAKTASDAEKRDSGLYRRVAYPAEIAKTKRGNEHVTCGHNPHLLARRVEGLGIQSDEDGERPECLVWTELH